MTTFRSSEAPAGLLAAFLDLRQNWYPGEIHTLTGYDQPEFELLKNEAAKVPETDTLAMLKQAANTLLGLPTTSDAACAEHIGFDWRERLRTFLDSTASKDPR